MRQSELFTKTRREVPKDEPSKNAELLIRGGFINKEMAGVYSFLPLGLRVYRKIENIIREEMNAIGGQEVLLTTLQDPDVWKASGRWDDEVMDIWFKSKLASGTDVGIANTHEEPLTHLLTQHVSSYKDLPVYLYQIQTKFRNELRAKSGILRGREFVMKDLYSFSRNEQEFRDFYEKCAETYLKIFSRAGLGDITFRTFASGGSFSKFSDEFQTLSKTGEDTVYLSREKGIAVNKEVYTDEVLSELGLSKKELSEEKAIEVGNIFPLGTRYSEALGLRFRDEDGSEKPAVMGCYGIGLGRLMGTVVEALFDEKGIVWPSSLSPFALHLVELSGGQEKVRAAADALYEELRKRGIEVLYDDRDVRAGEKFADADLIGIPLRAVISPKTVEVGKVELTERGSGKTEMISHEVLISKIK